MGDDLMPPRERRSRERIFLEILDLISQIPRTKTAIVYGINLNFRSADIYIEKLVEIGAIVWDGTYRTWEMTPKGEVLHEKLTKTLAIIEAIL
jgi:predicted transcriptional regulator